MYMIDSDHRMLEVEFVLEEGIAVRWNKSRQMIRLTEEEEDWEKYRTHLEWEARKGRVKKFEESSH